MKAIRLHARDGPECFPNRRDVDLTSRRRGLDKTEASPKRR